MSEQSEAPQLSEETLRMAAIGRGEEPAPAVTPPADAATAKPERPADIPEKFWDAEAGQVRTDALLKSYLELEKARGETPPPAGDEPPAGDPPAGEEEQTEEAPAAALSADLFASAQAEFAETQDLGEETRQKFIDAGIDAQTLDTYIAGVKALQEKIDNEIYDLAGGREAYSAAADWARENWSATQIEKFDASLNDPDLRELAIAGLMAAAKVPVQASEGRLTIPNGGIVPDDVYTDKEQFVRDLAKADASNDVLARKDAVKKLERSKKAGTLKGITPRSGTARFG